MTDAHVLTPGELRRLDAAYRPIEPFDAWADLAPPAEVWDRYVERYEAARSAADPEALGAALRDVARGASFDTGAIEGLYAGDRGITHTVMTQAATWEAYVAQERGPDVVAFVKAHAAGFQMALDLATGRRPVTESWVRQVHEVVCAPQAAYEVTTPLGRQEHALRKGVYKAEPNHVLQPDGTPFAYAPVDRVGEEMARLVEEVRGDRFEAAHPAAQAAYVHHAFVRIHPFADGNGRVARVLASVPLLQALSVPLVVYADQRPQYLEALRSTDAGDRTALVRFVADRALDVLDLLANGLDDEAPSFLARLRAARPPGLTGEELGSLARRLVALLDEEWRRHVEVLQGDDDVVHGETSLSLREQRGDELDGTSPLPPRHDLTLHTRLTATGPHPVTVHARVWLGLVQREEDPFVLRVGSTHGPDRLDVRVDDLRPEVATAFRLRASAWARRLVGAQLEELAHHTS